MSDSNKGYHEASHSSLAISGANKRHFTITGILVALGTVIMFLALYFGLPLPDQASEEAKTIDGMITWHLLLIAFLFALVVVFMVYAIVVFRKRSDEPDDVEGEHFEGNTILEIAWTAIPLVLVLIFTFYGIWALNNVTRVEPNEVAVAAKGQQWSWEFTHPTGVVSTTLILKLNQPVVMKMDTPDVMHGFWVPEFRVKQDLVPGQTTEVRFTPTMLGEFDLGCTVLCGTSHWSMVAPVVVLSEEEYASVMKNELVKSNPAVAANDKVTK